MITKNYFLCYFFWLCLALVSCQSDYKKDISGFGYAAETSESTYSQAAYEDDEETVIEQIATKKAEPIERKLIRNAEVRFQVKDIQTSIPKIEKEVATSNGFILNNNLENNSYQISYRLTIRVPNQTFDSLVETLASYAEVLDTKTVSAKDVTEEFVDVTARLATKKQIEERYLSILKQAKNIADILEVEKKLGEIREEIEATEGRLRYLQNQVSLSTIQLYVYQRLEQQSNTLEPSFLERVGKGFKNGWQYFLDFVVALSYSWPFIFFGIILILIIRRWIKKQKKAKIKAS